MKSIILFISIFWLININFYCQNNTLVFKNKNFKEEFKLKEGNKIWVTTNDFKTYYGNFKVFDSTHIIIQTDTLDISEINLIEYRTISNKIISSYMITLSLIQIAGGSIVSGISVIGLIALIYVGEIEAGFLFGSIAPVGVIIIVIGKKNLKQSIKYSQIHKEFPKLDWEYQIIK